MNTIFQLVLSTLLLLQLGTGAFIPFSKLMAGVMNRDRHAVVREMWSNDIDENESGTLDQDLKSHTCVYYNYKDDCHNSNDGCGKQTETCAGKSSNVGCYAVWSNNRKLLQGCWLSSSKTECTPGQCFSEQSIINPHYQGTYFCCCYGDNCNEYYGMSNNVPNWP